MEITIDTILKDLREWVDSSVPIDPSQWIEAAAKLNILKGEETKKLHVLQQIVASKKYNYISEGASVAAAKAQIECANEYRNMKDQEAMIELIEEQVRISKIQSRMGNEEYRGSR